MAITPTKLGAGGHYNTHSYTNGKNTNGKKPTKQQICLICNLVVAEGDNDAVEFDGQRYHLSDLLKSDPKGIKHKSVFKKLRDLHVEISERKNKSATETQNLTLLHKILFRTNGVSKR